MDSVNIDPLTMNWSRLIDIARSISPCMNGVVRNFLVEPFGEPVFQGDRVVVRAHVVPEPGNMLPGAAQKVALFLRCSDWTAVMNREGPLKVLQAKVNCDTSQFVLDCTGLESVVVSSCPLYRQTSVKVAEIFSGGFSGWGQAVYVLHSRGVDIELAWTVDVDPECGDMLRYHWDQWQEVTCLDELQQADLSQPFHICADVSNNWWLRAFDRRPINVACVSAPCQPWSGAGSEQGLASADGQLLLRTADVLGAFSVPYVLLEQVAHFQAHPHYNKVLSIWDQAGYVIVWHATLNLLDVLPGQRKRFLLVLRHRSAPIARALNVGTWTTSRRMNLGQARVLFQLPPPMKAACRISDKAMEVYMDPWYVPSPPAPHLKPQTPAKYRLRYERDVAGVFMAQYQFQHELPGHMLDKGVLACLLGVQGEVRFFAGPEIAAVHGAVLPIFLHENHRTQMRFLGNSIAVPHALVPLAHACAHLGVPGSPEPAEAVAWGLKARLHRDNSVLLPFGGDWVLCHCDHTQHVLARHARLCPETLHSLAPTAFVQVTLAAPEASFTVEAPPDIDPGSFFGFLGCPEVITLLPAAMAERLQDMTVQINTLPLLNCGGFIGTSGCQGRLGLILVDERIFVVELFSPRTWSQLLFIFQEIAPGPGDLALFDTSGQRLREVDHFAPCMIAAAEDKAIPFFPFARVVPFLQCFRLSKTARGFELRVDEPAVVPLWISLPFHLIAALGWDAVLHNFPSTGGTASVEIVPGGHRPSMPADLLHAQWRIWLICAQLDALSTHTSEDFVQVEVQLVARRL